MKIGCFEKNMKVVSSETHSGRGLQKTKTTIRNDHRKAVSTGSDVQSSPYLVQRFGRENIISDWSVKIVHMLRYIENYGMSNRVSHCTHICHRSGTGILIQCYSHVTWLMSQEFVICFWNSSQQLPSQCSCIICQVTLRCNGTLWWARWFSKTIWTI